MSKTNSVINKFLALYGLHAKYATSLYIEELDGVVTISMVINGRDVMGTPEELTQAMIDRWDKDEYVGAWV